MIEEKKMRTDKAKNTAKVLKEVIKNPLSTEREIAKESWVSKSSVNRAMQELQNNSKYKKLLEEAKQKTIIIWEDFKKEIDDDLLTKFIIKSWWKQEAMFLLEKYIKMYIWEKLPERNITTNKRYEVLKRAWFKCQACWEKPNKYNDIVLHIDHINPASLWWSNNIENLQVLCDKCNISKGKFYNINHNINEEW